MDLKKYFNSASEKRDLSSKTSTSGDDPRKILEGSLDDLESTLMMFLQKDYLLLTVLSFYITVLRMLRIKYMAFVVKQKKPK